MTRKDFIEIAKIIRDVNEHTVLDYQFRALVDGLIDFCQKQNSKFNRAWFEQACFGD